jgi:hypothetical protein
MDQGETLFEYILESPFWQASLQGHLSPLETGGDMGTTA